MTTTGPDSAPNAADEAEAYNYAVFPPASDPTRFRDFPDRLPVGSPAPDVELTRLDGGTARLSEYTRRGPTVIEFGSIT